MSEMDNGGMHPIPLEFPQFTTEDAAVMTVVFLPG